MADEDYEKFTGEGMQLVREVNLPKAKQLLDNALRLTDLRLMANLRRHAPERTAAAIARSREALKNIFKIMLDANLEPYTQEDAARMVRLRTNLRTVRNSFDDKFKKIFVVTNNPAFAAWASNDFNDTAIYFTQLYFDTLTRKAQAITLVHERAHTALRAPGHPGTGDSISCVVPHEGVRRGFGEVLITYNDAIRNAWCYEWLVTALDPEYDPAPFRDACAAPR